MLVAFKSMGIRVPRSVAATGLSRSTSLARGRANNAVPVGGVPLAAAPRLPPLNVHLGRF